MSIDYSHADMWRDLRSEEPNLLLRGGVSIALAALLAGFAVLGAYALKIFSDLSFGFDEAVGLALTFGAIAWLVGLRFVWSPARSLRRFVRPFIPTLIVVTLTALAMYFVDHYGRYDEEVAMGGIALLGGGIVVLLWLGTLHGLLRGRLVIGRDKQVDVRCPSCGYSLIGLTELRCPECGMRFTIDQLIRAQHYGGSRLGSNAIKLPGAPPPVPDPQERIHA